MELTLSLDATLAIDHEPEFCQAGGVLGRRVPAALVVTCLLVFPAVSELVSTIPDTVEALGYSTDTVFSLDFYY